MRTIYSFPEDNYYELEREFEYQNRLKFEFLTSQLQKYFMNPNDKNNHFNLNYKE